MLTTAQDSFNIFRPNLEPDEEEVFESESKESSTADIDMQTGADVFVDDENEEQEERRMARAAKQLNKTRNARSKTKE